MSRRYKFLNQDSVFEAFNKVRDAFLAAKNGEEVDLITDALITYDERLKIGRRIIIAGLLDSDMGYQEIAHLLKVGSTTILSVDRQLTNHPQGFQLIFARSQKVENKYREKAYRKVGGTKVVFKKTIYTGYKRKDVPR